MYAHDTASPKLKKAFLQQMVNPSQQTWLSCSKILNDIYVEVPELQLGFQNDIKKQLERVRSLMVLLLVHSKKIKVTSASFYQDNAYETAYIAITKNPRWSEQVDQYLDTLQGSSPENLQSALELLLEELPSIYLKELRTGVKTSELKFLLYQVTRYKIAREREVNTLINFLGRLQQLELQDCRYESNQKAIEILKSIFEVLVEGKPKPYAGTLGVIVDQPCLKAQKNLQSYLHFSSEYIMSLDENQLQTIFVTLTRQSITFYCLSLFFRISRMLVEQQYFFKIRHLYQNFVLSHLIRRVKCCKNTKIQEMTLNIAEYYVMGMWTHCSLGMIGMRCLLENIELVESPINKQRWLVLAQIAASKEAKEVADHFQGWLKSKKMEVEQHRAELLMKTNHIWEITMRSIKRHKRYKTYDSDYTGIINQGNQCYIISIVQALFTTKKLQSLLSKVSRPKNYSLIADLKEIFQKLASARKILPTVRYLKEDGPEEFARSQTQEDAQSYLIGLFEKLEKELEKEGLLSEFKDIFQIKSDETLSCKKCNYSAQNHQLEYVHTIPHTETMSLSYNQPIRDYGCPKCKEFQIFKQTKLTINCSILIVHINRFSVSRGQAQKELPTMKIKRTIDGRYELVGMVFHIGKRVQLGHYVYFSRIDKKRWAEMNDQIVSQFELDQEDEQFQLEMKQEKTPYILFYKKSQ